jgi:hypothetical protein
MSNPESLRKRIAEEEARLVWMFEQSDVASGQGGSNCMKWRAPSERIRTASEIPVEVDLMDVDAVPVYMKISDKVLHLRRLGMPYASIADHLGVNLWMAKKAACWGKPRHKR